MLIRMAREEDWPWFHQDHLLKLSQGFDGKRCTQETFEKHINESEIILAWDRLKAQVAGWIIFSKSQAIVLDFQVDEGLMNQEDMTKLFKAAISQMTAGLGIRVPMVKPLKESIQTFFGHMGLEWSETHQDCMILRGEAVKGKSFHFDHKGYASQCQKEFCPPCSHDFMVLPGCQRLADFDYAYVDVPRMADGNLFGKCSIIPKAHVVHFEDLPEEIMYGFMRDLQKLGKALRQVTGAEKINYEMHSNTMPHLHIHVYPRYLDDPYGSKSIDFNQKGDPYGDVATYEWFVEQMRKALGMEHLNPKTERR